MCRSWMSLQAPSVGATSSGLRSQSFLATSRHVGGSQCLRRSPGLVRGIQTVPLIVEIMSVRLRKPAFVEGASGVVSGERSE